VTATPGNSRDNPSIPSDPSDYPSDESRDNPSDASPSSNFVEDGFEDGSLHGFELGFIEASADGCNDGCIYSVEDGFEDGSRLGFELGFVSEVLMMAAAKAGETASRTALKMACHLVSF
jgi:hypothetical protein